MNPVRKHSTIGHQAVSHSLSNGVKVLMISGDTNLLNPASDAGKRLALQRAQAEQLDVVVWPHMHSYREFFDTAKATAYDVVTAQDPFWRGLLAWKVARWTGAKLNLQVHTDLSAQTFFRHLLARFLLRRADSVRVVSDKIQKQVRDMGVKAPIHVLPIYVDLQRFKDIKPINHTDKTILWIGRFEPEKAPVRALEALQEVLKQGVVVRLTMLGTGSLEPLVRKAAKGLPVEFLGWEDPAEYLPMTDVVLCTSIHESWGASIVEALAAGVPVVAPDVGIARAAGAIIAESKDFAQKIIEVLQSGVRGVLTLNLPNAEEWAKQWKETLI